MSDEMPDVIYAVTDVGKTKEGNWEVVDDAWLPAVVPTKYYSESHVEREYVPKAEALSFQEAEEAVRLFKSEYMGQSQSDLWAWAKSTAIKSIREQMNEAT